MNFYLLTTLIALARRVPVLVDDPVELGRPVDRQCRRGRRTAGARIWAAAAPDRGGGIGAAGSTIIYLAILAIQVMLVIDVIRNGA